MNGYYPDSPIDEGEWFMESQLNELEYEYQLELEKEEFEEDTD